MIGTKLAHYEILEKIGAGGMGEVYRARDRILDRDVALKILPAEIADDPARRERFEQEAKAIATLSHPNILAIYEFGSDEGVSYTATELLAGETLGERIRQGPLPTRKAVDIAAQVADGLAAAHERGVVHRDLKPDNIFITTDGRAKILDFGLARLERKRSDSADKIPLPALTEPGLVMGTVGYMSPEQVRGETVDARSDIFSQGVVLYEALTGSRAFEGKSAADIMGAILRDEPPSIRERNQYLPENLSRIVQRCLEKKPAERFQSASDLGFALRNIPYSSEPELKPSSMPGTAARRHRSWLVWVAGLGWLLAIGLIVLLTLRSPAPESPARLRPLTFSGRDWAPSASPAGDMVAFVSDRDGASRIWLKQISGGGEAPITDGSDDLPRFSPDGSQILFVHDRGGVRDLYRTSVVGGQPRKILDDVLEADWSPDGLEVAFLRMKAMGEGNQVVIGVADVQTGEERVITGVDNRLVYGIRWSPDGRKIAVSEASLTGMISENCWVDLVDVKSGELERVALTDWMGPYTAVEWGPAGRFLIAGQADEDLAQVSNSPGQMMEYDLQTRTSHALFWAPLKMPFGGRAYSAIAVLNANQIVFEETFVTARLEERTWTGTGESRPAGTLTSGLGRDRQPAYSPDGERIIFSSNRSGNIDLWIVDRRSGALHQLTDDPADDWDPAFSPDGLQVVWSSNRGGNMEIWIAAADGSLARQVTRDGVDAENPTMTADGQWIIYASSNDAKLGVWKIRPDGSDATLLLAGSHFLPEVSPDGRLALCGRFRGVDGVIQVLEVETGELVPFEIELGAAETDQNIMPGRARWTPDGRAIAFVAWDDEGRSGILVEDFDLSRETGRSRRSVAGFSKEFDTESFGISPDGRHITVSAVFHQRTIKLAENVRLSRWE